MASVRRGLAIRDSSFATQLGLKVAPAEEALAGLPHWIGWRWARPGLAAEGALYGTWHGRRVYLFDTDVVEDEEDQGTSGPCPLGYQCVVMSTSVPVGERRQLVIEPWTFSGWHIRRRMDRGMWNQGFTQARFDDPLLDHTYLLALTSPPQPGFTYAPPIREWLRRLSPPQAFRLGEDWLVWSGRWSRRSFAGIVGREPAS